MGTLLNRRRYMGGGSADEIIMTSTSNPEVMTICYAQGWASHADYMTLKEAQNITSIGTVFRGASIVNFDELQYFTKLTSIEGNAFYGCSSLSKVTLPTNITSLGTRSFYNCYNLNDINLSNIVTIGNLCFYQCTSLVSVNLSNVEILAQGVFWGCSNLSDVGSVANIISLTDGTYGQFQSTKLTGIYIFEKATGSVIPTNIFNQVSGVTEVSFPLLNYTSIGSGAFRGTGIPSFVVREGCLTLNNHSFSYSSALLFLDLPSTLTTWSGYACYDNRKQKVIVCRASTPPTGLNANSFASIPSTCKVYVPSASISAYESATGWLKLAGKYVALEGTWYETHRELEPTT